MTLDPLSAARWSDVILVVAAAPFVLLAELPLIGYFGGAAAWSLARVLGYLVERRADASSDLRTRAGLTLMSSFGRAWFAGLAILAIGVLSSKDDGLVAAVTVVVAFTVYLVCSLVLRPLERNPSAS